MSESCDPFSVALLRLLQLTSPSLPIGAFAYSQALEQAVHVGWVNDEGSTMAWILGLLEASLARLEVPAFARLAAAWRVRAAVDVRTWNDWLAASRPTSELRNEDRLLGQALAALLSELGLAEAAPWRRDGRATHLCLFALAAERYGIDPRSAASGYLFSWCEAQLGAACRLVPLGQTASQRILSAAIPQIVDAVEVGLSLGDGEIGYGAPLHAILSSQHESLYSRLFRS